MCIHQLRLDHWPPPQMKFGFVVFANYDLTSGGFASVGCRRGDAHHEECDFCNSLVSASRVRFSQSRRGVLCLSVLWIQIVALMITIAIIVILLLFILMYESDWIGMPNESTSILCDINNNKSGANYCNEYDINHNKLWHKSIELLILIK